MTKPKATTLEEQVKTLQRHFGSMIVTMKDLKCSVDRLEKKVDEAENKEIKDIIEQQKVMEKVIAANAEAIKRLDEELIKKREGNVLKENRKDTNEMNEKNENNEKKKTKICRYFNRGYCKYKSKCRFVHSQNICEEYLKNDKCGSKICTDRHPKRCNWIETTDGCRRDSDCEYLHVTPVSDDNESYKCEGCKDVWSDKECVVEHLINGKICYFCLNCNDWIHYKAKFINEGGTLLDRFGNMRTNI